MVNNFAQHIAIIPDGNRRWSKLNNTDLETTYFYGCQKMLSICGSLFKTVDSLEEISLFFVSLENLKTRSKNDLDPLFIAGYHFLNLFYTDPENVDIELRWIGLDYHDFEVNSALYGDFVKHIKGLQNSQKPCRKKINVLIGYDVKKDIERAMSKNKNFYYENLEVSRNIDLIIRTGGYRRLSGFLPLICQYSEFSFIDKLFLDVTEQDICNSIEAFNNLSRNFGK